MPQQTAQLPLPPPAVPLETFADAYSSPWIAPHAFAHYFSRGAWSPWRHLVYISNAVAECINTPGGRLIVNIGPRWGKSELISDWSPTWFLSLYPDRHVMLATAAGLARVYGGKVRDRFAEFPEMGVRLKEDSKAKNEWKTPAGGGMKSVTVNESVMGRGAHAMIIDDPYGSWADAWSPTYRKSLEEWYTATCNSRLEPDASIVLLHHRMHALDLTNYVLKAEDGHRWRHISLPSIATGPDDLGRVAGESLCPERFSAEELEKKRVAMRWAWEPMHQQNAEGSASGKAFKSFTSGNIDAAIKIEPNHPVFLGIDFNINPGMHMEIGQHFPNTDTFHFVHEIHDAGMSLEAAMREFIKMWASWEWKPEVLLFGDPAGNARNISDGRSNWQLAKTMLRAKNIKVRDRVPAAHPGIVDSLLASNEALFDTVRQVRRVKIHTRCERLLVDMREVPLDEDGKPVKTDESLTHAGDIFRYVVHSISPIRGARIKSSGRVIA